MKPLHLIAVLVAIVGLLIAIDQHSVSQVGVLPPSLGAIKDTAPVLSSSSSSFPFGRYRAALSSFEPQLQAKSQQHDVLQQFQQKVSRYFQHKRWAYVSLSSQRYWIGMAVANLNYIANCFFYVVDKETSQKWEYTSLSPASLNVIETTNSSLRGCTSWQQFGNEMRLCGEEGGSVFSASAKLSVTGGAIVTLAARASLKSGDALALLYPIHSLNARPAYTHKAVAIPATLSLSIASSSGAAVVPTLTSESALAGLDWTSSMAARITIWKWASFSYASSDAGGTVGINFSDDVYNSQGDVSQENAVWLDGRVYIVGKVLFNVPANPAHDNWSMKTTSEDGDVVVDLVFEPRGTREEHLNVGLISSDFVQPYGVYSGRITVKTEKASRVINIVNAYGVAENHYAKW